EVAARDDCARVAVFIVGRQTPEPRRSRLLGAKHLLVFAQQESQRGIIPGHERIFRRLPDRRLLRRARASTYLQRELFPGVEAVVASDRKLSIGKLARRLWIRCLPALETFLCLFPVLLEAGMRRESSGGHTNLLSLRLGSARIRLKEGS